MAKQHAIFSYLSDKYYQIENTPFIVIPDNADYKKNTMVTQCYPELKQAELDIYNYATDLTSECNAERVAFMKEFLISEKIKNIDKINRDDYIIEVSYDIFNKDGKIIKNGTDATKAKFCMAVISSEVNEINSLEYRKAFVYDGRIEVCIPEISRYGIKNAVPQNPYTIRIKAISLYGTIGDSHLITSIDTQVNTDGMNFASSAEYHCHRHPEVCLNNYAEHFVTNAKIGTTMIDNVVAPAVLEIPPQYTLIKMCTIPAGAQCTTKVSNKLNTVVMNVEILLDNFNEVYDYEDIFNIMNPEDNTEPPLGSGDGDNTDNTETPDNNGTGNTETPDNTGDGNTETPDTNGTGNTETPDNTGDGNAETPDTNGTGNTETPDSNGTDNTETPDNTDTVTP
jgi:hypothetical protein